MHKRRENPFRSGDKPDPTGPMLRRRSVKSDLEAGGETSSVKEREEFLEDMRMSNINREISLLTTVKDV